MCVGTWEVENMTAEHSYWLYPGVSVISCFGCVIKVFVWACDINIIIFLSQKWKILDDALYLCPQPTIADLLWLLQIVFF